MINRRMPHLNTLFNRETDGVLEILMIVAFVFFSRTILNELNYLATLVCKD